MGRTVRKQIVRGRNLVGTDCKGGITGRRSVRGRTVGVPPNFQVKTLNWLHKLSAMIHIELIVKL